MSKPVRGFASPQYGVPSRFIEALLGAKTNRLCRSQQRTLRARGFALRIGPMSSPARILIVEDDALIAMELGERVEEMGYSVLKLAHTLEQADVAIAQGRPDAALLDANLNGTSTVDLGVKLAGMGVPFAFCTGYDSVRGLPAHLAKTAVLTKPIGDSDLRATLEKLLGR